MCTDELNQRNRKHKFFVCWQTKIVLMLLKKVMRGVSEVLLSHKPDGIYAFNIYPDERKRRELLRQIGSLQTLKGLDKTYSYYTIKLASKQGIKRNNDFDH